MRQVRQCVRGIAPVRAGARRAVNRIRKISYGVRSTNRFGT